MNLLLIFGEAHTVGIVLEREDHMKLKSSKKLTYATWFRFFDEGDGDWSKFVIESFVTYYCRGMCRKVVRKMG